MALGSGNTIITPTGIEIGRPRTALDELVSRLDVQREQFAGVAIRLERILSGLRSVPQAERAASTAVPPEPPEPNASLDRLESVVNRQDRTIDRIHSALNELEQMV